MKYIQARANPSFLKQYFFFYPTGLITLESSSAMKNKG